MPILKMKPHMLEVLNETAGYEDENGDFHKGTSEWVSLCECDVVPAGSANKITLPDGAETQYSYTIYLPKKVRSLKTGEKVRIKFFGETDLQDEKKEFVVKGFHAYQHQCKMWV